MNMIASAGRPRARNSESWAQALAGSACCGRSWARAPATLIHPRQPEDSNCRSSRDLRSSRLVSRDSEIDPVLFIHLPLSHESQPIIFRVLKRNIVMVIGIIMRSRHVLVVLR